MDTIYFQAWLNLTIRKRKSDSTVFVPIHKMYFYRITLLLALADCILVGMYLLCSMYLSKDVYRKGRNTRFWLLALKGNNFGLKTFCQMSDKLAFHHQAINLDSKAWNLCDKPLALCLRLNYYTKNYGVLNSSKNERKNYPEYYRSQGYFFFICPGCQMFILCEIHCYLSPPFWKCNNLVLAIV